MKKFAKIQLFSFLVFGLLFLFLAVYLEASGRSTESMISALVIAGTGQIVIFNVILFVVFREKIKEMLKK